jgi:hypothetical protein
MPISNQDTAPPAALRRETAPPGESRQVLGALEAAGAASGMAWEVAACLLGVLLAALWLSLAGRPVRPATGVAFASPPLLAGSQPLRGQAAAQVAALLVVNQRLGEQVKALATRQSGLERQIKGLAADAVPASALAGGGRLIVAPAGGVSAVLEARAIDPFTVLALPVSGASDSDRLGIAVLDRARRPVARLDDLDPPLPGSLLVLELRRGGLPPGTYSLELRARGSGSAPLRGRWLLRIS